MEIEDVGENIDLKIPASLRRDTSRDHSIEARNQFNSFSSRSRRRVSLHKSLDLINRKRRHIPTFATTTHSAFQLDEENEGLSQTQKDELFGQYKQLAQEYDRRLLDADYIDRNIAAVAEPRFVRMANETASLIHSYRQQQRSARQALTNQAMHIQEDQLQDPEQKRFDLVQNASQHALRQCECHIEPRKRPFVRNTDGIIYRENRHRCGINSRPYDSICQQMDLRLKPRLSVQKTQKMVKYFKKKEGLEAEKGIPIKSMVPLDSM